MYETYSTIVGRVISDPRRNRMANGDEVISFRMASNTRRRDRATGEWIDGNSLFLTVSCWRRLVAGVASAIEKGRPVIVHGAIHTNTYTTSDGESRTELEMIADSVGLDLARCVVEYRGRADSPAPRPADAPAAGVDAPGDATGAAA
ncbi:single-stranded DNA-binding protein [Gordonia jacobaea]|uniref:single-stranded DNA-binding protein n=1 Tax=Gordonia jacobaea TaxID=122202 RepID=UPI003D71499A